MQNITSVMNYHPIISHKDHPQCAGYQRDHHQTLMLSTSSRRCRRGKQALAWSRNFYQLLQHLRHLRRSSKVKHLTKAKNVGKLEEKAHHRIRRRSAWSGAKTSRGSLQCVIKPHRSSTTESLRSCRNTDA